MKQKLKISSTGNKRCILVILLLNNVLQQVWHGNVAALSANSARQIELDKFDRVWLDHR